MELFKYRYDDLFNPTITAIHNLGSSARVSEIEEEVTNLLKLSDEQINEIHSGNRTRFSYRLAWARTYLKNYGILENSDRGVWRLTPQGLKTKSVSKIDVKNKVKLLFSRQKVKETNDAVDEQLESTTELVWQEQLINKLQTINPDSFERLCQRMLREQGFENVQVIGRSGDGGIDGKGTLKIAGVLSFPVVFQCKRYKGIVSPSIVRDFRGSMDGRTDKGILFTTGTYSQEAIREAHRPGAIQIDLVDGSQLAEILKNLGLGIEIQNTETVKINEEWFDGI
ncbi:restriction endonuclease [Chloroflexota bacterium]